MPDKTSSDTPRLAFVCASLRDGSINQRLESALMDKADAKGFAAEKVDLGDYEMPLYHGDLDTPDTVGALIERLAGFDGVVIVTPEYNGSLPPLLKNVIDWTSTVDMRHIRGPVYGIASCTPGPMSGIMCLRQLNYILTRLGGEVVPTHVGVGNAASAFDATGTLIAEPSAGLADTMLGKIYTRIREKAALAAAG